MFGKKEDSTDVKKSADAKLEKFSNPHKLGFLRFVEVCYVIEILFTMVALVFVTKDEYLLGPLDYALYIGLLCKGVALWLITFRKKATLVFIPAFYGALLVFYLAYEVFMTGLGLPEFLIAHFESFVVLVYMLTSRRMKAVMTRPFDKKAKDAEVKEDERIWRPLTFKFWRHMVMFYCIFSIVGHWMEAAYCTLIRFGIMPGGYDPNSQIWHDWLYPFMVYGTGFCVCVLILFPVKLFLEKRFKGTAVPLVLSYVVNTLACVAIELQLGLTCNQNLQCWDYSNMFMNFQGQVCLLNSCLFGAVATIMTWVVYPMIEKLLGRLSNEGDKVAFVVVVLFFAFVYCLYCMQADPVEALRNLEAFPAAFTHQ